jgi:hypothetical protein
MSKNEPIQHAAVVIPFVYIFVGYSLTGKSFIVAHVMTEIASPAGRGRVPPAFMKRAGSRCHQCKDAMSSIFFRTLPWIAVCVDFQVFVGGKAVHLSGSRLCDCEKLLPTDRIPSLLFQSSRDAVCAPLQTEPSPCAALVRGP